MCAVDPGVYDGKLDESGLRHWIGKCKWNNNDTYEGDWKKDLRHGNGKFACEDYTYVGQWQLDLKHGRGKMICNNGETIVGTWMKDKINGIC